MAITQEKIDAVEAAIAEYRLYVSLWESLTSKEDRAHGRGNRAAEDAGIKRASMDLTRALARLRKPS